MSEQNTETREGSLLPLAPDPGEPPDEKSDRTGYMREVWRRKFAKHNLAKAADELAAEYNWDVDSMPPHKRIAWLTAAHIVTGGERGPLGFGLFP